jgi:hypothetical protein
MCETAQLECLTTRYFFSFSFLPFYINNNMHSIWGKKSKEAQAEKKKPRTSAAQIRVQKGKLTKTILISFIVTLVI